MRKSAIICACCWAAGCGAAQPSHEPLDAASTGAGDATLLDASVSVDAASPTCTPQLPTTGEPDGIAIDHEGFGCYGACGPGCTAECQDESAVIYKAFFDTPGNALCLSCSYAIKQCKSHAFCRWHDDCYRQCDARWDAEHDSDSPSDPANACYNNCSVPVVLATPTCAVNWSMLIDSAPHVTDDCWDGSSVTYSRLLTSGASSGPCPADTDVQLPVWGTAGWSKSVVPPATLPQDCLCQSSDDCPDRNQSCAGTQDGGGGTCSDIVPAPHVDVSQLAAPGTYVPGEEFASGQPCAFGFQCKSGQCAHQVCAP